ncbi:hypothetical protein [Gluconobacter morbifer]|uniref:hypothetical protein n=1 Tax=Gluconobacter morbifer TaxID=479935 RepID=UPI001FE0471C|nr:hypothetical protein [Gluconobacter morbifer]
MIGLAVSALFRLGMQLLVNGLALRKKRRAIQRRQLTTDQVLVNLKKLRFRL